jgi:hypothetical protein
MRNLDSPTSRSLGSCRKRNAQAKAGEVIRRHAISRETFLSLAEEVWRAPGERDVAPSRAQRMRIASQTCAGRSGTQAPGPQRRPGERVVTMEQRRTIVDTVRATAESERRAFRWMGFHRSAVRYVPDHRDEHTSAIGCGSSPTHTRAGVHRC